MGNLIGKIKKLPGLAKILVGWAAFCVIMLVVVLVIRVNWVAAGRPDLYRPTAAEAYDMCTDAMLERLKAPATAQFADLGAATITKQDNYFFVDSWVDSENAFGALLRTHYTCTVQHVGDGDYRLRTLETR